MPSIYRENLNGFTKDKMLLDVVGHTSFNAKMNLSEFGVIFREQDSLNSNHKSVVLTRNVEDVNLESN